MLLDLPEHHWSRGEADHEHRGTGDNLRATSAIRSLQSQPTVDR
jgi:hypothetical protein